MVKPSGPDATYSGHKGQGYQVQIMETYCKQEEAREGTLNLITHVQVDPAHERGSSGQMHAIYVIKEHLLMAWSQLRKFFAVFIRNYGHMTITTA